MLFSHLWSRCMRRRSVRGPSHSPSRHTISPSSRRSQCQQQRATSGSTGCTCHSAWCWSLENQPHSKTLMFLSYDVLVTRCRSVCGVRCTWGASRWRCPGILGTTIRCWCLCSAAQCSHWESELCCDPGEGSAPYLEPESAGTDLYPLRPWLWAVSPSPVSPPVWCGSPLDLSFVSLVGSRLNWRKIQKEKATTKTQKTKFPFSHNKKKFRNSTDLFYIFFFFH